MLVVPDHQVVLIVDVDQLHGRLDIEFPAVLPHLLLALVVLEILELDLSLGVDGVLDAVDVVVHRLVLRFDAPLHVQAALERVGHMGAAEPSHGLDQRIAFLLGEEARRLHRIGQKHELGFLELARRQPVLDRPAVVLDDVVAERPQALDIPIERLALDIDALLGHLRDDLRAGEPVLVVGLLFEQPGEIEQLELARDNYRHGASLRWVPRCTPL